MKVLGEFDKKEVVEVVGFTNETFYMTLEENCVFSTSVCN
jgi:hypothetical protein